MSEAVVPRVVSADPRGAQSEVAQALVAGVFDFYAGTVRVVSQEDLFAVPAAMGRGMYGFGWLHHLVLPAYAAYGRGLVEAWCAQKVPAAAREAGTMGRRVAAWAGAGELVQGEAVQRRLHQEIRKLKRLTPSTCDEAWDVGLGLVLAWCYGWDEEGMEKGQGLLEQACGACLLGDGGHHSRSPQATMEALFDMLHVERVWPDGKAPAFVRQAIERLTPMVRFFSHGDGGLAVFNGGWHVERAQVEACLERGKGKQLFTYAPHTGFQRLAARRLVVLVDAGGQGMLGEDVHAGCLSFEMSSGIHRVVVNCGAGLRETAKHSTVEVGGVSSVEKVGKWGRKAGRKGPTRVVARRREASEGLWLDVAHDGYASRFGVEHSRRLFVAADGYEVRGEDMLMTKGHRRVDEGLGFRVRFHLHPDVRVVLEEGGEGAMLVLTNMEAWRMRVAGGRLTLAQGVYTGEGLPGRQMRQLVVEGKRSDSVRWGFRRVRRQQI